MTLKGKMKCFTVDVVTMMHSYTKSTCARESTVCSVLRSAEPNHSVFMFPNSKSCLWWNCEVLPNETKTSKKLTSIFFKRNSCLDGKTKESEPLPRSKALNIIFISLYSFILPVQYWCFCLLLLSETIVLVQDDEM